MNLANMPECILTPQPVRGQALPAAFLIFHRNSDSLCVVGLPCSVFASVCNETLNKWKSYFCAVSPGQPCPWNMFFILHLKVWNDQTELSSGATSIGRKEMSKVKSPKSKELHTHWVHFWQISYSKFFEVLQQISPGLPRSMAWVMTELGPGEVTLHTIEQSLKCSVQTWPAGILGRTQNYKIDWVFSQGFLLVTVAVSLCFKASWRCSNCCLRGSESLTVQCALGWICLECSASVITLFTQ